MKLFSGSCHPSLAREIAEELGISLSEVVVTRFGNSEVKVGIKEDVRSEVCVVVQPTSSPTDTHLMEFLFFADALRRSEARAIIGVVPYFGYAKQNFQHIPGENVSAQMVIQFMEIAGYDKIITFDLHDEATAGIFRIPFANISAMPYLAEKVRDDLHSQGINTDDVVVVSPDQGGVEKVRLFARHFYDRPTPIAMIEKSRDQNIPHKAQPVDLYGDVSGKVALIVDDMVVSGSTLAPAVNITLAKGARKVYSAIIHHDFIDGSIDTIESASLKAFYTTNSIPLQATERLTGMKEFSLAPLIVRALQ